MANGGSISPQSSPGNASQTPQTLTGGAPAVAPKKPKAVNNYSVAPVSSNPVTREVSDNELVSKQMTGLLSDESEYIKIAKRQAAEAANERGMLNTSLAIGAGREAAIKAALPIAQQDAATHYQTQATNQNTVNDFSKTALQQQNTLEADANRSDLNREEATHQSGLQEEQDVNRSNLNKDEMQVQSDLQMTQDANKSALAREELGLQSDYRIEELTEESRLKLQTSASDATIALEKQAAEIDANYRNGYLQSATNIVSGAQTEIANIYSNTNMNQTQQANAVASVVDRRDADIAWLTSSVDALKNWPVDRDVFAAAPAAAPETGYAPNLNLGNIYF